jgi:hypothetical protein
MQVLAPLSGSFASVRSTRPITCHRIYTSLLPPSSRGFNFCRIFHPSRNTTNVNPFGPLKVSLAVCGSFQRLRRIGPRCAPTNTERDGQTRIPLAAVRESLHRVVPRSCPPSSDSIRVRRCAPEVAGLVSGKEAGHSSDWACVPVCRCLGPGRTCRFPDWILGGRSGPRGVRSSRHDNLDRIELRMRSGRSIRSYASTRNANWMPIKIKIPRDDHSKGTHTFRSQQARQPG